jgi:hypothetical protein
MPPAPTRPASALKRLVTCLALLSAGVASTFAQVYDGVIIDGDLTVPNSTTVTFINGAGFTGTNATIGSSAFLYWNQVGLLDGKLVSIGTNGGIYLSGPNRQLTLGSTTTVSGDVSIYTDGSAGSSITNLGTINHNSTAAGQVYAPSFTNAGAINVTAGTFYFNYPSATYAATNALGGTITASGSGTNVYIRGNVANAGAITAQNSGRIHIDGDNTTANLGNITIATGGRVFLEGTLNNASATLTAPTGGTYELATGTIAGGTVNANAITFTSSGGTLNNATLSGNLSLANSAYVRFVNGANFDGSTATLGNSAFLYWGQSGSLDNKAITIGSSGGIYVYGLNSSLTLGSGTTLTGTASIYSDGSAGTVVNNAATITHTSAGSGSLYAETFNNSGQITATAGTLFINYPSASYTFVNQATGIITAEGAGGTNATVYIRGNVDNNGILRAQNGGILYFDGNNTTANLGAVELVAGGRARLNGTINNTLATLQAPSGGSFDLYGGTITGGDIATGALNFTGSGGYLDNTSLSGDLTLANSAYVRFTGGTGFTGGNANLGSSAFLYWGQTGTLTGKQINVGSSGGLYVYGAGSSLTLAADTTVTGHTSIYSDGSTGTTVTNLGTITHSGTGGASMYAQNFTNSGSITATDGTLFLNYPSTTYNFTNSASGTVTASNATIYVRGNFDNNGVLTAQNNGILHFDGNTTTANLGNVVLATGGRARIAGEVNNTLETFNAPTGGSYDLYGGRITGGTITSGALTFTSSGGYLDNAALGGNLSLPNSTYVRLVNGASFGGNLDIGSSAFLYWGQAGTLAGKTINVGSSGGLYVYGASSQLTLASDSTLTGTASIYTDGSTGTAVTNLGTITHSSTGAGYIYANSVTNAGTITATSGTLYLGYPTTNYSFTNTGSITVTGTGTDIYARGTFDNNGTITAQSGGTLTFDGDNTTANLGNIVLNGGTVRLNGTIDNTGATLSAPTGGAFNLYNGRIMGGTINANALTFTNSGGYIDNASIAGDLTISPSGYVRFQNGANFTGSNATIGSNSYLYWGQVGALTGKTITTSGSSSGIYIYGAGNSLTIGPGTTVSGNGSIYSDGSLGTTVTNQGSITHTAGTGYMYARSFNNSGTITATGGTVYLGSSGNTYPFLNGSGGSIVFNGATGFLSGTFTNAGTLSVMSGSVYTSGTFTNLAGGLISGAGTIFQGITLAGGTLSPGNSIGTLTLANGPFLVTAASTLEIEIAGTSSDRIVFSNPTTIDFSTNLLTLSLSLLAAPVELTTYDIMTISSGGTGMTGRFAGLPNSGDTVTASFGSNTYSFTIEYLANSVQLTAVPEPSTYALLAIGVALVAVTLRRRRG